MNEIAGKSPEEWLYSLTDIARQSIGRRTEEDFLSHLITIAEAHSSDMDMIPVLIQTIKWRQESL